MARLDLNSEMKSLPKWDFSIVIDGVDYAMRQPTLLDDSLIPELHRMSVHDAAAFIYDLFCDPKPPKSALTRESLVAALYGLLAYREARRWGFINAAGDWVKAKCKNIAGGNDANPAGTNTGPAAGKSPLN